MVGFYCPFRVFGNGTKCHNGRPFREFDIKEGDDCSAWEEIDDGLGFCILIWGKEGP